MCLVKHLGGGRLPRRCLLKGAGGISIRVKRQTWGGGSSKRGELSLAGWGFTGHPGSSERQSKAAGVPTRCHGHAGSFKS